MKTRLERFMEKIEIIPIAGCWIWTGAVTWDGYGRFKADDGKMHTAHRFSYQVFKGEMPAGLEADHLCRVRCCVNPDHLEPVTKRVNQERGISPVGENIRKTYCKHGHPLSGKNLSKSQSRRVCLACSRRRTAEYVARKTAS